MPRHRRLSGLIAPILLLALAGRGPVALGDGEDPVSVGLAGLSGRKALAHWQDLARAAARKSASADGPRIGQRIRARMSASGLQVVRAGGTYIQPFSQGRGRPSGHNVLGRIPGVDQRLDREVILVGAAATQAGCAVLLHLAETLTSNRLRPRRTLIFCAFGEGGGSLSIATRPPFRGDVVSVLDVGAVGRSGALSVGGVGAYPAMGERLAAFLPEALRARVRFSPRAPPKGDHWPFHERGSPSVLIEATGSGDVRAEHLATAARVVGTLAVRLANHPEPMADPLGVASYLVREGPRFAGENLVTREDASLGLLRHKTHAERMKSGLSALILTIPEDCDPAATWRALERFEAREGPVRYRLVRRAADIARAHAQGHMAIIPRLCCAASAHADPKCMAAYAALGYRWLAPWYTATARVPKVYSIAPIVAAGKKLGVLLDAGGLPTEQHAALRKALGDRPAVHMDRRPLDGTDLGPLTLPLVRFKVRMTWLGALESAPGLAPPVVYVPRGQRLAKALATWGKTQPAGWAAPGSAQRKAVRAALGGRLMEWLARVER